MGDGDSSFDLDAQLESVARRVEYIDLLDERGPLEPRDIVDALDHSRSTVTRALRTLREADLVERTDEGYRATLPAVLAAEQYHRYRTASEAVLTAKELLAPLPEGEAPPVDLLVGADTVHGEGQIPIRPLGTVADRVRDADEVRLYLPTLVDTQLLRAWHWAVVADGADSTGVVDPDLLTALKGQYPRLLAEMAATGDFSAFSADSGPPYGIVVTRTGDTTSVSVIVYEGNSAVRGVATNDAPAAVEWARDELDALAQDGTEVTADLAALSDVAGGDIDVASGPARERSDGDDGSDGSTGHALPLAVETEGFVRLSEEYFDTHRQATPAVSWRSGFTLADVRAGHALDRRTADGRNLTDVLVDQLRDGADHVVLGPPGSGKSTVCMAVACAWYDRGCGPVLYRERGGGDHFASSAALEAYLRRTDEHALVVVEDAVREEANAVFEVMRALDGDSSVTFLLDARTDEWADPDTGAIDARLDTYRRTSVDRVTVPDLTERECTRFVEHFADLVDTDPDLSGTDLFELLREDAATDDESVPEGDVLVAQHYLSHRIDPPADIGSQPVTALDEAVRDTYRRLADADGRFPLDAAVLATLLTAAGIPVADEYLYALADPGECAAVGEAVALLDGRVLFDRDRAGPGAPATYRTRHEAWAHRFLETMLDIEPAGRARDRFGRCVTRLLALADEPRTRERIQRAVDGRASHLHRIAADPGHWADEAAARIFRIGHTNADLAPLFGETTDDTVELPASCSTWTAVQQAYWRGKMNRVHGDLDRAEREFHTLCERAETVELADETAIEPIVADAGFASVHDLVGENETPEAVQRTHWRAKGLLQRGRVVRQQGDLERAREHTDESLALFREVGDRRGEAWALNNLGIIARERGELQTAADHYEESLELFREHGDRHGEAGVLGNLGMIAYSRGALEAAQEHFEESLALFREIDVRRGEAWVLNTLALVTCRRGQFDTAVEHSEEGLALVREIGDRRVEAWILDHFGRALLERGEIDRVREHLEESLALFREVGLRRGEAWALNNLGVLERERGDYKKAADYHEESRDLFHETGDPRGEAWALDSLGILARERGKPAAARDRHEESLSLAREVGDRYAQAKALHGLGVVAREQGDAERARTRFEDAAERYVETGAVESVDALRDVVDACERQGDVDTAVEWCQQAIEFAERTDRPEVREEFEARRADLSDAVDSAPTGADG